MSRDDRVSVGVHGRANDATMLRSAGLRVKEGLLLQGLGETEVERSRR